MYVYVLICIYVDTYIYVFVKNNVKIPTAYDLQSLQNLTSSLGVTLYPFRRALWLVWVKAHIHWLLAL